MKRFLAPVILAAFFTAAFHADLNAQNEQAAETKQNSEAPAAAAQDDLSIDDFAKSPEEAIALGPNNKLFMDKFTAFRDTTKKLNALKVEMVTAKAERQKEIVTEYTQLVENGTKMAAELLEVGFKAFDETPNRNPFVNNYLYNHVIWEFSRDNYEEAVRIFKHLCSYKIPKEMGSLYVPAGLSAIMTMDLDEAESWLKTATDNGQLEAYMKDLAQSEKGREEVMKYEGLYMSIPKFRENWAKEKEIRKKETEEGEKDPAKKLPRVLLKTTKGDIVVELFENEAPNTVANFISLVEKGFYNGTPFHRVLPGFMAQGGDPTGTGRGGPGYSIDCENKRPDARKHFRGTLSMAHAGPNSGGSQFFLTFVPTSFLDRETRPPGHTVFGRVVDGIEILADIQRVDPMDEDSQIPILDKIEEAKVLNKRDHEYQPIKNANQR